MEQRKEFKNQLHIWALEQEKLGDDIDVWSARVFDYAARQNELLASPMTPKEINDIAWDVAKWRWLADGN